MKCTVFSVLEVHYLCKRSDWTKNNEFCQVMNLHLFWCKFNFLHLYLSVEKFPHCFIHFFKPSTMIKCFLKFNLRHPLKGIKILLQVFLNKVKREEAISVRWKEKKKNRRHPMTRCGLNSFVLSARSLLLHHKVCFLQLRDRRWGNLTDQAQIKTRPFNYKRRVASSSKYV